MGDSFTFLWWMSINSWLLHRNHKEINILVIFTVWIKSAWFPHSSQSCKQSDSVNARPIHTPQSAITYPLFWMLVIHNLSPVFPMEKRLLFSKWTAVLSVKSASTWPQSRSRKQHHRRIVWLLFDLSLPTHLGRYISQLMFHWWFVHRSFRGLSNASWSMSRVRSKHLTLRETDIPDLVL